MLTFGYNNNAIGNQKLFKPIANGDVADSSAIVVTDEPFPFQKPKKEWKFRRKSWIKELINCCFSQNITKHKLAYNSLLNVSMLFSSYLYKYFNKYQGNQLDIFITTSTYFYDIPLLVRLSIPHYQKTWKVQCKLRDVNVIH